MAGPSDENQNKDAPRMSAYMNASAITLCGFQGFIQQ